MAIHHVAIVATLLALALAEPAWSQTQNGGMPDEACLSSAESRDLFVADKLLPPFRVMRESARNNQAEAIDIQLCRADGALVYDVTLLGQQERLFHRLINATDGAPLTPPPRPQPAPDPRPALQAPRQNQPFFPGRGPNIYTGPRLGPNFYPGVRPGPNYYPGLRPGSPFFPGARSGGRGPGVME